MALIPLQLYISGYMIAFTYPEVSRITQDTNIIRTSSYAGRALL